MKRTYTVLWALWGATAVTAEVAGAGSGIWWALLTVFATTEAVAVWRVARGDTLSEHVWWWVGTNRTGRALQAAVWGLWLSWHFYLLTPGGVGSALLSLSIAVWLVPHFYTRGATG